MALFFDRVWFTDRLEQRGLALSDVGPLLGLTDQDWIGVVKDQRLLTAVEMAKFAELLGAPIEEVASRAGIAMPGRAVGDRLRQEERSLVAIMARLDALERRLAATEAMLAEALRSLGMAQGKAHAMISENNPMGSKSDD